MVGLGSVCATRGPTAAAFWLAWENGSPVGRGSVAAERRPAGRDAAGIGVNAPHAATARVGAGRSATDTMASASIARDNEAMAKEMARVYVTEKPRSAVHARDQRER